MLCSVSLIAVQLERNMWQQPVDGGAISARGKLAAAEDQARKILEQLTTRGLKEAFIPNPALLENGQVGGLWHCHASRSSCPTLRALVA